MKKSTTSVIASVFSLVLISTGTMGQDTPLEIEIPSSGINKEALVAEVAAACPIRWENLKDEVLPETDVSDVWLGDAEDKQAFEDWVSTTNPDAELADIEAMVNDFIFVANECISRRISLLTALLDTLPQDVVAAIANLDYDESLLPDDGYSIGDIRETGRLDPSPGWMILFGQTIGSDASTADYRGDILEELFYIAKNWKPNQGDEDWIGGDIVFLPDMRSNIRYNNIGKNLAFSINGDHLLDGSLSAINKEIKYSFDQDVALGFSQTVGTVLNPGLSCKAILEELGAADDGSYWIDVPGDNINKGTKVYCDMTTNGGGWTMVAYLNDGAPANFFGNIHNENHYSESREEIDNTYSLGIMDHMDDTELMITFDSPDPAIAIQTNKVIQFSYPVDTGFFNNGPFPCLEPVGLLGFRVGLDGDYDDEWSVSSCTSSEAYLKHSSGPKENIFKMELGRDGFWDSRFSTDDSGNWGHTAWFYVR